MEVDNDSSSDELDGDLGSLIDSQLESFSSSVVEMFDMTAAFGGLSVGNVVTGISAANESYSSSLCTPIWVVLHLCIHLILPALPHVTLLPICH